MLAAMSPGTHHLHLVSDATGETIASVARAVLVQFDGIEPIEHVWSLIRTAGQVERVLSGIRAHPGPVLYTLVNDELRGLLVEGCRQQGVPTIPVLDPIIRTLASIFGGRIKGRPGSREELKKFCDHLMRQGFGYGLIREKLSQLPDAPPAEAEE